MAGGPNRARLPAGADLSWSLVIDDDEVPPEQAVLRVGEPGRRGFQPLEHWSERWGGAIRPAAGRLTRAIMLATALAPGS